MRIILFNFILLICFTPLAISGDETAPCSPELDYCRQVIAAPLVEQLTVETIDAGAFSKKVFIITASADGTVELINDWNGFDSSLEVTINVEGQGLCASDKSTKTRARNGETIRVSATCVAVIDGVKTVHITRTAGGGMVNTVLANPENTKLRYSWAELRKVKKIN
jgi:hypothetical protein